MIRTVLLAVAVTTLGLTVAPRTAEAGDLLEIWVRPHGTLGLGGTDFFSENGGPHIGFGGEAGLRVFLFEAYVDINRFDNEPTPDGSNARTYFNQIGGGLRIPVPLPGKLRLMARVNANYAYTPYVRENGFVSTGGLNVRGGVPIEYDTTDMLSVGFATNIGYGLFGESIPECEGSCDLVDNNGINSLSHIYLRLRFSFL